MKAKNSLATTHPKLATEWHPTKNGNLKPTDITAGSGKKVWWLLSYDDPKTGKHFDFEWEAVIYSRANGASCPYLTGHKVWQGFNDLATTHPNLAKEWHPTKNGDLKPTDVTAGSEQKVYWLLPYDDPKTGKHFDFEWQAAIIGRTTQNNGCPYLSNPAKAIFLGFNDLVTTHPDIAAEWHPTKNGNLKPTDVTAGSGRSVWWSFSYDDPKTGKHFEFEWKNSISNRTTQNNGCPYLSNEKVWTGFNDLATTNPELAKEWHPTKNGNLKPTDVTAGSNKKVYWLYPYDDPKTGEHFEFEWQAAIIDRTTQNNGCPYLSGKAVWQGYNDLATTHPELAKQWHPIKNGELKPADVTGLSNKIVWWLLPYDDPKTGKHFDFEWKTNIYHRTYENTGCPYLASINVWVGFNDLATTNPELAAEWHPTKNGNLKPTDVMSGSSKKVYWLLPYDDPKTGEHFEFEWQATILHRNHGRGCPFLSSSKTEVLIYRYLKVHKIEFEAEKKFENCRSQKKLPFDIYIKTNLIIECDGMQHFEAVDYFGGEEAFNKNKEHDNIKNQYCKDNNIPLLRIPYIYDPVVDKNKIEQLVLDFIQTKQVPQEIIDFYAQYSFSNYCK